MPRLSPDPLRALLGATLSLSAALLLSPGAARQTSAPSATLPALADAWAGQIIYQVMPDRFADGDPGNNKDVDKTDSRAWHGGDLKGLRERLNYITDLGATALWLTPVYTQKDGLTDGTAGYHGYWPYDFRNVDPHFGTLADFKALTTAAHAGGLKVMLDQVINHYGPGAPALTQHPDWFTSAAKCAASRTREVDCPLSGLPDLDQSVPAVRALLEGNAAFWRAQGVDAFRYDAVKHVPAAFTRALLARDRAAGTFTLGEYYGADAASIAAYQQLGLDSVFDFSLQAALKASLMSSGGLQGVRGVLEAQAGVPQPRLVATFLDNHDLPRYASGTLFEDEGQLRTAASLRALMTLRGVPVIWQGTEIAMRGGGDPDNRRDMRFPESWTAGEKAVYAVTRDAIAVRKAHPALRLGDQTVLTVPDAMSADLLVLQRQAGTETVMVAWNTSKQRQTYSLKSTLAAQALTGSLFSESDGARQPAGLSVRGGYLHLSLPPRSAAAFVVGQ